MIFSVILVLLWSLVAVQSSDVFMQKGKDVLLDVNNVPENFFLFVWKFDKKDLILVSFSPGNKPTIRAAYTGRIDSSEKNSYSVILKNLQETDSGVYIGQILMEEGQHTIAQHNIIVQDVVSPVVMKVNSVSNISDYCGVTLTCSAADSHISSTFRCVNQECHQDGGTQSKITDSSATLEFYLMNFAVICRHSNRVSSTEDMTDIKHVCPQDTVQSSDVFVQKGKDVLLDVKNVPEKFIVFVWKFDKNDSILVFFSPGNKPTISEEYTGRIDVSEKNNYSVILKNLQETDSGVYTARVTGKKELTIAQHNIIVQDVVSPVVMKVNSLSNISGSYNVTLTCSAADSHISSTFRCVNQECHQDGGNQSKITDSSATLEFYLMNFAMICRHSNRVSSTKNMTDIKHVCPQDTGSHSSSSISFCLVKIVVFSVGLFLMVSALIGLHLFDKLKKQK